MVSPCGPAVATGTVWHRRNYPTTHDFTYPVNQVWIDPDRPEELFDKHPLWSHRGPRPVRFRRADYFDGGQGEIGPTIRSKLKAVLGLEPTGPIRMLTQPRTWGWLFNPITIYLVWHDSQGGNDTSEVAHGPAGAVLEVTNTPWKERHHYPVALQTAPGLQANTDICPASGARHRARFAKELHVSPFLDEAFDYELSVREITPDQSRPAVGITSGDGPRTLEVALDVHRSDRCDPNAGSQRGDCDAGPVVETRVQLQLNQADGKTMSSVLYRNPLSTHRVSLGIHWQAARLLRKHVPFVAHPRKRT